MATQITPHFTYEPFWNNSATAKKYGINNTPDASARSNIYKIVREILEPIAVKYGKPIRVNSSYRCPKLNKLVGGSPTSQHMTGTAVDIAANGGGGTNAMLFNTIIKMIKNKEITVGQLIWEYGTNSNPQWVHVSLPYKRGGRPVTNQVLRCVKGGKYIPFDSSLRLPVGNTSNIANSTTPTTSTTTTPTDPTERGDGISFNTTRTSMGSPRSITSEYKKR